LTLIIIIIIIIIIEIVLKAHTYHCFFRITRFPTSPRWSSYVAPKSPKGDLKNAKLPDLRKNGLRLKKVCYKVSLCENCQRQSCKAFIGLTNRSKMIGGRPLLPEILDQSDSVGVKSSIFALLSLVAPQP